MKKFKVFAERIVVEEAEVEAETEAQALAIAAELDNDSWSTSHDADWNITSAKEVMG
jgi:hypothetical protein